MFDEEFRRRRWLNDQLMDIRRLDWSCNRGKLRVEIAGSQRRFSLHCAFARRASALRPAYFGEDHQFF